MEAKLAALTLLLESLGIGTDISSKERRLKVQKSVYLLQAQGIKLGYSFSWYINGPYSTTLTRDYYDMRDSAPNAAGDRVLNAQVQQLVAQLAPLLDVPEQVGLNQANWLELLASVHYLRRELGKDAHGARAVIQEQKSHLLPHYASAENALQAHDLL